MDDNETLETPAVVESEPAVDYTAKKKSILILLLAYSAILGVIYGFDPGEDQVLDKVLSLPLVILGISWCFTDAAERHHRIGGLMKLLLILLFIAGFPIYLFQTRGIGAFKSLGLAVLFITAMFTCLVTSAFITALIVFGGEIPDL